MQKSVKENSAKTDAIKWIRELPDHCTLEDIQYYLYVRHQVAAGLADVERGNLIPHEEAKRRMKEWLKSRGLQPRSGTGKR